jgi:hypothetical protein
MEFKELLDTPIIVYNIFFKLLCIWLIFREENANLTEHMKYQYNCCTTAYEQYVTSLLSPCNATVYIYITCFNIKASDKS